MIKRANPLRVLLADDEKHMQAFVGQILSSSIDCTITTVSDGAAAIEHCRTADSELVILDINMPRVDGVKALTEIRQFKPELPIIMMTSIADEFVVEECLRKGASYYIRKDPFGNYIRVELESVLRDFFPPDPKLNEKDRSQPPA